MSRYYSYLNSAKEILSLYKGEEPFASFIKKYFAQYKKFGSKDRRTISHLCYSYFRLGKALPGVATEEKLLLGLLLGSNSYNEIIDQVQPAWKELTHLSIEEKIKQAGYSFAVTGIFSIPAALSSGIDTKEFSQSHLMQPDLFIRLRPGKEALVKSKLNNAGIQFEVIADNCLALPNASKIDTVIALNHEAVIQDLSSQKAGLVLQQIPKQKTVHVWDCCAASGGKSIMAKDILKDIELTVSDIRESILANLSARFKEAGIQKFRTLLLDLTKPVTGIKLQPFDLIIADVPCSGSGTWGRTPEQLLYFSNDKIDVYANMQQQIVSNVIPYIKPGGYLLYITCSVFKKENEAAVEFLEKNHSLTSIETSVIKGYDKKADTMFVALLQKASL